MGTTLYQRHFATAFDMGWHRDIPQFTPADWRDFLLLAATAWVLKLTDSDPMDMHFIKLHQTYPHEFWMKCGGHMDPRIHVRCLLTNMISPMGELRFDGPGAESYTFRDAIGEWYAKKDETIKQRFLAGLILATKQEGRAAGYLYGLLREITPTSAPTPFPP